MIYTVEQLLEDKVSDAEWSRWSSEMKPVSLLLSVPGFLSAQRFKGIHCERPPSIAVYSIASAEVLTSGPYLGGARGGNLGSPQWRTKLTYWYRNLYSGIDVDQGVPMDSALFVFDTEEPNVMLGDLSFHWLTCVGLDKTTPYRGLAVVKRAKAASYLDKPVPGLVAYEPLTEIAFPD